MHATTRTEDLFALLDEAAHLPPEYAEGLSNHLPMALHALHEMGAAPQRMLSFAQHYGARFTPWPHATQGRVLPDWTQALGRIEAYADLNATFCDVLRAQGRDGALRQLLPALWPGVAAAAFHGLIRTAHAVQNGHEGELAAGLAYWAARWQPMVPPQGGPSLSATAWADALSAQGGAQRFAGRLISDRMAVAQHAPAYQALAGRLPREAQALPRLARLAVQHYVHSGNFTVLHMVTACRAARVLQPWLDEAGVDALINAFTAAFLVSGVGPPTEVGKPSPAETGWPEVTAAAVASDDDHVVKFVHACIEEAAVYGQGSYLLAARRAVA